MKFPRYEPNRLQINKKRYHRAFAIGAMGWSPKWDLTGKIFGRLTVTSRAESLKNFAAWNCQCQCGATKVVRGTALRTGQTVSCGCYQAEVKTTHGRRKNGANDPTYTSFVSMKSRVLNPQAHAYEHYGGRGISICQSWMDGGFEQFLKDMGERPPGTSLDRIDVNGNYSPANCKWSTPKEQSNNRRQRPSK
jgi:hypothetical protein